MEYTCAKTKKDLEEIADMMGRVFRRLSWFEFYKNRMDYQTKAPYYKPEHSRIAREDGRLMGHVSIVEKYIRIGESVVRMAGIGDVFTHPDARGKHVSSHLMNDSVEYMRREAFPLSMLYGIPNFYHKFGYIEAMGDPKIFLPVKNAAPIMSDMVARACAARDVPDLNRLYNQAYSSKTGSIRRIPESWYNIADPKTLFVFPDRKDKPAGYCIYKTIWGGGGYISEVVAPMEEVRIAALAFAVQKAREAFQAEVEFHLAVNDPFVLFLKDFAPRHVVKYNVEGEGGPMFRLINLPMFLKNIKATLQQRLECSSFAGKSGGIGIITDDAGNASIIFDKGRITIQARVAKNMPIVRTPQNLLVRSLVGYWDSTRLAARVQAAGGDFHAHAAPVIKALFPETNPYTLEADYF